MKASQIKPEPVKFLCDEPLIPLRGLTVVAGRGGVNKTSFGCWLAAKITNEGHEVAYFTGEDDLATSLVPKLQVHGADLDRVSLYDVTTKQWEHVRFGGDGSGADALGEMIEENGWRLVIIDPLTVFVPSLNTMAGTRAALSPVKQLSQKHDCAIVFVHHFRKSGGKSVGEAMGGSGGIRDVARAVYVFGNAPEVDPLDAIRREQEGLPVEVGLPSGPDGRILANEKMNDAATPDAVVFGFTVEHVDAGDGVVIEAPTITLAGTADMDAAAVWQAWADSAKADRAGDKHTVEEAAVFLLQTLVDGPRPTTEVNEQAKALGISQRTLERARTRAGVQAFQEGGQWFLRLAPMDEVPEEWS